MLLISTALHLHKGGGERGGGCDISGGGSSRGARARASRGGGSGVGGGRHLDGDGGGGEQVVDGVYMYGERLFEWMDG